jgi:hypothetical protein
MLSGGMKASSSRSTRVIEELQENWDNIQKEVESTKSQVCIISILHGGLIITLIISLRA